MKMQSTRRAVLLSALCLAFAGTAMPVFAQSAADAGLTGNGSTFGAPLYGAWGKTIGGAIPGGFHYDPTNSLEGIFRFQGGLVDIGASDVPMTDEQINGTKGGGVDVAQIPTAYSAIVITYNLPGYNQPLKLTGEQLAKIYLGEIQWWNDPELVANNPGLKQHAFRIITFHRADGSGTTRGFTSFLNASSTEWQSKFGVDFAVYWPIGDSRGGNPDLVQAIKENANSIGYTELPFALKNGLPTASIMNPAGHFIQPTLTTVSAAVTAAGASNSSDLRLSLINASGDNSYPVVTGTYLAFHRHQPSKAKAGALTAFLRYAVHEGQSVEGSLYYVSLPPNIVAKADAIIQSIN